MSVLKMTKYRCMLFVCNFGWKMVREGAAGLGGRGMVAVVRREGGSSATRHIFYKELCGIETRDLKVSVSYDLITKCHHFG